VLIFHDADTPVQRLQMRPAATTILVITYVSLLLFIVDMIFFARRCKPLVLVLRFMATPGRTKTESTDHNLVKISFTKRQDRGAMTTHPELMIEG
jgi:hypothetical protein